MPTQTKKQVIDWHKKKVALMVESFIKQTVGKTEEEILKLYEQFADDWSRRCTKVYKRHNEFIISYDVWERIWKVDGYLRIMTIPIPKQLDDEQKDQLKQYKAELLRIVYTIEGKTEKQRERRQDWYKLLFIFVRLRLWFKSLFHTTEEMEELNEIEVENKSENALTIAK